MKILDNRPRLLLNVIASTIFLLMTTALSWINEIHYDKIGSKIGYKWLFIVLLILFFTCIYLLVYLYNTKFMPKESVPKLKLIYSLSFDINGNPYCTSCILPLSIITKFIGKCTKCNNRYTPSNISGGSVTYTSIKNNIKRLWKDN